MRYKSMFWRGNKSKDAVFISSRTLIVHIFSNFKFVVFLAVFVALTS